MQKHEAGVGTAAERLSTALICLTRDRESLMKALKTLDKDCAYCKHNMEEAPCAGTASNLECTTCDLDCYCKDCTENSKWEWAGKAVKTNDLQ